MSVELLVERLMDTGSIPVVSIIKSGLVEVSTDADFFFAS